MKHELKIVEIKLSLKKDDNKIEPYLRYESEDLRSHLTQVTSEVYSIRTEHAKLVKYKSIVKGESTQAKKKLEKLYTNREKIDEQLFYQISSYDNTGVGCLIEEKKPKEMKLGRNQKRKIMTMI